MCVLVNQGRDTKTFSYMQNKNWWSKTSNSDSAVVLTCANLIKPEVLEYFKTVTINQINQAKLAIFGSGDYEVAKFYRKLSVSSHFLLLTIFKLGRTRTLTYVFSFIFNYNNFHDNLFGITELEASLATVFVACTKKAKDIIL
ncbi:hypothetical protein BpHYR1_049138 [Brachionus plicatilis]|uniref:Uncharacterized protein n=1 Tax=Brachionus plicatilis TaxID=10195 RepID=A0A3M7SKC7_BRAPC|nr:hypothetical protein BpHYR1_049138 [Brachionus plicatilis]